MAHFIVRAIGVAAGIAFAILGRWVYWHPKLFLEKFLGKGISHGRPAFIWAKLVGGLWAFVAVGGILAGVFGWLLGGTVSTGFFIAIQVALSMLITWELLKARPARPEKEGRVSGLSDES